MCHKPLFLGMVLILMGCSEKLVDKPKNLVSKAQMEDILYDMAVFNAARSMDFRKLEEHNVAPTVYVLEHYGIDSLQFVESDRYYASKPAEYEEIYTAVTARLEKEKTGLEDERRKRDSLEALKKSAPKPKDLEKK